MTAEHLDLAPIRRIAGTVRLPGSKSISNRVLLLAALAQNDTLVRDLLDADDTGYMLAALAKLGVACAPVQGRDYRVRGSGGAFPMKFAELFLGNAGTAVRPLTAALAFSGGRYRVSGAPRMHERPIRDLVDALRGLGADIAYAGRDGFPPLEIRPGAPIRPAEARVRGDVSSQYVTALLMALPLVGGGSIAVGHPFGATGARITTTLANELIDEVGAYKNNAANGIRSTGVAHLMTGRNLDGSTVGIAYLESICNPSFGVSLSQGGLELSSTSAVLVAAHEIGHNFGAPHDAQAARRRGHAGRRLPDDPGLRGRGRDGHERQPRIRLLGRRGDGSSD